MKIRVEMEQEPIVGNWFTKVYCDELPVFCGYVEQRSDVFCSRSVAGHIAMSQAWADIYKESEQFRYSLSPAAFAHIQPSGKLCVKPLPQAEQGV